MQKLANPFQCLQQISGQTYLWIAVIIFGASGAVTRRITEIGAQNFVNGENPISLCNVLFVGNLCALIVFLLIYRQYWNWPTLKRFSRRDWLSLGIVSTLAGAIAPGLIFEALTVAPVTNVVLLGRLEPPLTLALSIWLLGDRVNRWELAGAIVAFLGVALTLLLQPPPETVMQAGGISIGLGDLFTVLSAVVLAISTIIGKKRLGKVPLGIYTTVRTGLGAVIFFLIALALYGHNHFMGVLSPFLWRWMLVYGVIIVVIGQSSWLAGLRNSSVSTASIVGSFTPLAGILAAYLILGEVPTMAQYIGGAVILLGLGLSQKGIQQQTAGRLQTRVNSAQVKQAVESGVGFKGI